MNKADHLVSHTGSALRSFSNIACHFNILDLAKHLSPYASFNLESVLIVVLLQRTQYFTATCYSATMSMFFTQKKKKKKKRSTNSKIEHQLQYAIRCMLYNRYCSSPAQTTRTCLYYQLAWCTTRHQVIIPF